MEKWKVIDFASNYEVSNIGRVRNRKTQYILKGRETHNGYLQVSLKIDDNGKFMNKYIHRLVAQFWLENKEKNEVNHKDGNKKNNNVNNLEWVTSKENSNHRVNVLNKKITSNKKIGMFDKNGTLIQTFESIVAAGQYFKKSRVNIDNALKHKNNQKTAYGYVWKYLI